MTNEFIERNVKIWRLAYNLDVKPILRRARRNPTEMPKASARVPMRIWSDLALVAIMIVVASLFWVGRADSCSLGKKISRLHHG